MKSFVVYMYHNGQDTYIYNPDVFSSITADSYMNTMERTSKQDSVRIPIPNWMEDQTPTS